MPNYKEGKIYRLVNSSTTDCYYGSTCDELRKRKYQHKTDYIRYLQNQKKYITSFKIFEPDIDDVDIILVESFPCSNKEELHARERWYIENNDCVNKYIPTRTQKEYNRDVRPEQYQRDKDKINIKMECECGKTISRHHYKAHTRTKIHQQLMKDNEEQK